MRNSSIHSYSKISKSPINSESPKENLIKMSNNKNSTEIMCNKIQSTIIKRLKNINTALKPQVLTIVQLTHKINLIKKPPHSSKSLNLTPIRTQTCFLTIKKIIWGTYGRKNSLTGKITKIKTDTKDMRRKNPTVSWSFRTLTEPQVRGKTSSRIWTEKTYLIMMILMRNKDP